MTDDFGVGTGGARREGGSDYGSDIARDLGDEPPATMRDAAPDLLSPIDASAPVSGHVRAEDADDDRVADPGAELGGRLGRRGPGPPTGRLDRAADR